MGPPQIRREGQRCGSSFDPLNSGQLGGTTLGNGKPIPAERQARTTRLPFLAAAINAEHRAVFGAVEKALEHAAGCGRHLIEAKALVPHGDWLPWLKANTEVVPRQSQKYMRLAIHWEQVSAKSELGGSHLALNDALQLIADPKPKPKPRCYSAGKFIGEVTLIHRGWIPDFRPKGGGGPWPSDINAFYADNARVGPPLEVQGWQRKAARFHWSGWLPDEEEGLCNEDLEQALADEELRLELLRAEERRAEERRIEELRRAEGRRIRATLPNGTKKHCPHCGGVLP